MDLFDRIVGENFQQVQFLAVGLPSLINLHGNFKFRFSDSRV
jgi:hypothetical protein